MRLRNYYDSKESYIIESLILNFIRKKYPSFGGKRYNELFIR
jgi:hypothetical protein